MNHMSKLKARDLEAADGPVDPMALMSEMLTAQAIALDNMFTDLVGHSADVFEKWPSAAGTYARLALRAQSNCRTSLETVVKAERATRRI
jgi:hypothetical protein